MATGDRERLDSMADRIMGPYMVSQQLERRKLEYRGRQVRLMRIVGACLLLAVVFYLMLR